MLPVNRPQAEQILKALKSEPSHQTPLREQTLSRVQAVRDQVTQVTYYYHPVFQLLQGVHTWCMHNLT